MVLENGVEGKFRFRLGRHEQLVLYKRKDEASSHLKLRAIAYALFFRECDKLCVSPRLQYKVQPDFAVLNWEGEPELWIQCLDSDLDILEYVCKHIPAREVVLVTQERSIDELVACLRRKIHYRYTSDKLKIINLRPPIEEWFDAELLDVPTDAYDIFEF
ncbi:MAG: YaeQ family protein [Cyanobacteria bacterium NC_groundwater_1444_Ag_S-0.65um_54_12]|nr:YaeQ family protein [Cyanobacteria bacterium NC_groundwater_1444_Ag_S-0.65um_54_12]